MKIKIKKSPTADSRTADHTPSVDELKLSSYQHIEDVRRAIRWMIGRLEVIASIHDYTKIRYIDDFHRDFKKSMEDKNYDFKSDSQWFKTHVTNERHHLTDRVPDDVNLFDVLERVADICVAGMARSGKVYSDVLDPDILEKAYKNTIILLLNNIDVDE